MPYTLQLQSLVASQSGDPARGLKYLASIDARPLDFHITFHISESFAMAGAPDRALAVLEEAVEKGFYAAAFIETHCPFMAPLRGMPEFGRILAKAKQRATAFTQAVASPVH